MFFSPILHLCLVTLSLFVTSHYVSDFKIRTNRSLIYSILCISFFNILLQQVLPFILILLAFPGALLMFGMAVSILAAVMMPVATFLLFFISNLASIKIADKITEGFRYNKRSSLFLVSAITAGLETIVQVIFFKLEGP